MREVEGRRAAAAFLGSRVVVRGTRAESPTIVRSAVDGRRHHQQDGQEEAQDSAQEGKERSGLTSLFFPAAAALWLWPGPHDDTFNGASLFE